MATSLQVKNKGVSIIGVGSKTVYKTAKSAIKEAAVLGKKGYEVGKEGAIYAGKKGYEYGKKGYAAGKEGALIAGMAGYEVGKGAYTKIKGNETVQAVGGAVYKKTTEVGGATKEFLSSIMGKGKKEDKKEGDQLLDEDKAALEGEKPKSNEEKKE